MAAAGALPESRTVLHPIGAVPNLRSIGVHPAPLANPVRQEISELQATPWWLWWNILSADAPTVAVIWAALFARASGVRLSAAEAAVLALAVWVIYATDRLLDGCTATNRAALQQRHLFSRRHPFVLTAIVAVAGLVILWLVISRLPAAEMRAGVKLGAILVAYMAAIHLVRSNVARVLPKEIAVGVLFASGATLPFWSQCLAFPWNASLLWALFALLCSLNCVCIERWESRGNPANSDVPPHPFARWAGRRINRLAGALALAAAIAGLARIHETSLLYGLVAICLGSLLMIVLNCWRNRLSPAALRVLADAALAIPPLGALLAQR